jgi:flagellar basal body rod protein FlgB
VAEPVNLFDETFNSLEKAMAVATKRQAVIAQNIANAKTPGYEALSFDEELDRAVKRQDKRNVTLEEEMAALAENSGRYSAYVKMMTSKMSVLRSIVTQGRK